MNCPVCYYPTRRVFQKEEYWISECNNCSHRYADFSPTCEDSNRIYQDEYFKGGPAGYPDYLQEAGILMAHGRRYGELLKKYTVPGRMLDVGCAAGFILKGFEESGWEGFGLEPNPSMVSYGRTHLGLRIETGVLENFSSSEQFDLVSMIQVIAHFYNVRQALEKAAMVTRPGGFWLIETWNKDAWIACLLGRHWHEYSPPSVLHYFSRASLCRLISQFGFTEVTSGRPKKRISGAHAKSLLDEKLRSTPLGWLRTGYKFIPDTLVIPYPSFDLFWILFQKVF